MKDKIVVAFMYAMITIAILLIVRTGVYVYRINYMGAYNEGYTQGYIDRIHGDSANFMDIPSFWD